VRKVKKIIGVMGLVVLTVGLVLAAGQGESKYDSGTTAAEVNFKPYIGKQIVKAVYATTDKAGGTVKIYASNGVKVAPTTAPTNGATVIAVSNASYSLTNGDHVVYVHLDGTLDKTTVSTATTSNVTLAAAITVAGATGDYLYELTQQAQLDFDTSGAGVGTNKYGKFESDAVFITPSDSPIYVVADGTSNCVVNVAVER